VSRRIFYRVLRQFSALAPDATHDQIQRRHYSADVRSAECHDAGMLAAVAHKDYDDRRRRQMQGIAKGKTEGKYRGRPEDKKRNTVIMNMLKRGMSWNSIIGS
jgi:DNA invertase Pin-like site-specific DNA recombinase